VPEEVPVGAATISIIETPSPLTLTPDVSNAFTPNFPLAGTFTINADVNNTFTPVFPAQEGFSSDDSSRAQ
jgi:hypothetical protein